MSTEKNQHQDQARFFLDGLKAIAEAMQLERGMHGCTDDQHCAMIRSCVQMALSNSTFEGEAAKALLCSVKPFMQAVVAQLQSPTDSPREDKGSSDESEFQKPVVNCEYTDAACCEEDELEASHRQSSRSSSAQSTCCQEEVFCVSKMTPTHVASPKYKLREVKNELPLTVIEKKINVSQQEFSDITKKIQDITLDDAEYQEQPVNYSLKYSEEPGTSVSFSPISGFQSNEMSPLKLKPNVDDGNTSRCSPCLIKKEPRSSSSSSGSPKLCLSSRGILNMSVPPEILTYGPYTETDLDSLDQDLDSLDQPIDFSRKYHEYNSEDCTDSVNFNGVTDSCPLPDVSKDQPKLSCGDEDTVKVFCTEDTPLNFSSASSLTDLRDVGISGFQTPNSMADEGLEKSTENYILQKDEMFSNISVTDSQLLTTIMEDVEIIKGNAAALSDHEAIISEEKVEKIDEESSVNVTPLMFSRSSSLGSLNSFDQPSSHDDQSSVSEFSHLASGVISPSDLPDSPLSYTPKVFEFENAPVTFSSCNSSSPLHSEDGSIILARKNCPSSNTLSESTPYMLMHSMNFPVTNIGNNRKENLSESKLFCSSANALPSTSANLKMPMHRAEEMPPKLRENYLSSHCVIKCIQQNESTIESVSKLPFPTSESPPLESHKPVSIDGSSASHLKKAEILAEEKAMVNEFISLGMPKNRSRVSTCSRSTKISNSNEEIQSSHSSPQWSPPEHALQLLSNEKNLRQSLASNSTCKGIDHFKHSGPTSVHASTCLNPSEKAMIEECISLGMPKSRSDKRTDLLSKMRRTEKQHLVPNQQGSAKHAVQCEQSLPSEKASCSDTQKKVVARPSKNLNINSERSTVLNSCKEIDLPPDERALLEEYISLGMQNRKR